MRSSVVAFAMALGCSSPAPAQRAAPTRTGRHRGSALRKRGVSRSTGSFEQHTLANEAEDLLAVVNTARSRTFARIGLLGHSEGSMVSARVAETTDEAVAPAVTRDVSEFIARQR